MSINLLLENQAAKLPEERIDISLAPANSIIVIDGSICYLWPDTYAKHQKPWGYYHPSALPREHGDDLRKGTPRNYKKEEKLLHPRSHEPLVSIIDLSDQPVGRQTPTLFETKGIDLVIPIPDDSIDEIGELLEVPIKNLRVVPYFIDRPTVNGNPDLVLVDLNTILVRSDNGAWLSLIEEHGYHQVPTSDPDGRASHSDPAPQNASAPVPYRILLFVGVTVLVKRSGNNDINLRLCKGGEAMVATVKSLLFSKTKIPPHSQKLLYDGVKLEEGKRLIDYGISDMCTLHLVYTFGGISTRAPRAQTFRGDLDKGTDLLGVEAEVWALADAIALKELEPPFAVGVLGSWGSGKSFAMNLIKSRLGEIMEIDVRGNMNPETFPYVGHIYTVDFSAWTYAKKNLWSSLMFRILSDLNDQLSMEEILRKKNLTLMGFNVMKLMELSSGERTYLEEYLKEKDSKEIAKNLQGWNKKHGEATDALVRVVQLEHQNDVRSLPGKRDQLNRLEDQIRRRRMCFPILGPLHHFKQTLTKTTVEIFINDLFKYRHKKPDGDEVEKMLEMIGLIRRYMKLIWGGCSITLVGLTIVGIGICLLIPLLLDFAIGLFLPVFPFLVGAWRAVVSTRKQLERLGVTGAIEEYNGIKLKEAEKGGSGYLESLLNQKEVLENDIKAAERRVWLVRGDSLLQAVQKRLETSNYEAELGVVHQAHMDLLQLSEAMTSRRLNLENSPGVSTREAPPEDVKQSDIIFPRGRPRIVLFIDDLDRCPPDQVVEVLEALQLLVKTKLFVAVVSMDMRYVTRSLEIKYHGVLDHNMEPSGLEYVQKIIQLPYQIPSINPTRLRSFLNDQMQVLTSMDSKGLGSLISEVSSVSEGGNEKPAKKTHEDDSHDIDNEMGFKGRKNDQMQISEKVSTSEESVERPQRKTRGKVPPFTGNALGGRGGKKYVVKSEALHFTTEDLDLIEEACMVALVNPRTARRLVNVFKVIKIVWAGRTEPKTNIKRKLLLMLALASSCPRLMGMVLEKLEMKLRGSEQPSEERLDEFMHTYKNISVAERFKSIVTSPLWGDVRISELGLEDVRLLRSFSFFGDYTPE